MRSRAADALGKIGGPRVIDAVLQLVRDKDEDIRRAAIEILNQTKDERAIDSPDPGHPRHRLVGQRARRRCAGRDRQQARPCRASSRCCTAGAARRAVGGPRARQARRCADRQRAAAACCARTEKEIRVEAIARARAAGRRAPRRHHPRSDLHRRRGRRTGAARSCGAAEPGAGRTSTHASRPPQIASQRQGRPHAAAGAGRARCSIENADLAERRAQQATRRDRAAPGHHHAQARRHHRGPLQVHRAHRQGRLRHRAADGGHGRRGAADPEVPEPERAAGRGDDEALRARAALLAQDHAQQRHPHLRLPVHPGAIRDLDGVFPVATPSAREIVNEKPMDAASARCSSASTSPPA